MENIDENNETRTCGNCPRPGLRLFLGITLTAIGTSLPFGINITVINIPQAIFEDFVNQSNWKNRGNYFDEAELKALWSFIVSAFTLGGAIGGLASLPLSEKFGRKWSLLLSSVIVIIGSILSSVSYGADSMILFTVGRVISGLGCGMDSCLLSIFLSEISPIELRGFAGGFQEIFIVLGKLLGQIASLPNLLGGTTTWPFLIALPGLPALLLILLLPLFPETPKFLRSKLHPVDSYPHIAKSIRFYHGSQADTGQVMSEIDKELELVRKELSLKEIFLTPVFRKCLIMAVVIRLAQEFTGITAIFNFSTGIFETLQFSTNFSMYNSIGLGVVSAIITLLAAYTVEHIGRRIPLVYGLIGTLICDVVFMVFALVVDMANHSWAGYVCLLAFYFHVCIFSLGPGPIGWLIVPELVPQVARSGVTSSGVFVNWASNLIVTAAFLPAKTVIGDFSFLIFIIPLAFCCVYLFLKLPETKGKPVDEITKIIMTGGRR